jgi:hypothetical protein
VRGAEFLIAAGTRIFACPFAPFDSPLSVREFDLRTPTAPQLPSPVIASRPGRASLLGNSGETGFDLGIVGEGLDSAAAENLPFRQSGRPHAKDSNGRANDRTLFE